MFVLFLVMDSQNQHRCVCSCQAAVEVLRAVDSFHFHLASVFFFENDSKISVNVFQYQALTGSQGGWLVFLS